MSSVRRCLTVVLAAGEGTRMRSNRPKVLHKIAGRSLLAHALAAVQEAGADDIAVVIGPDREDVGGEAIKAAPLARVFVQAGGAEQLTPFSPRGRLSKAATTTFSLHTPILRYSWAAHVGDALSP